VIVLGTDSGLERTGYSIFIKNNDGFGLIEHGYIFTEKEKVLAERLYIIAQKFREVLTKHKPDVVVFERLFFNTNQITAINVAQAQGVLLAMTAEFGAHVEFLTPPQIKQIVTGDGKADKKQVAKMVQMELKIETLPKPDDVVDAIACGLAYLHLKKYDG